MIETAGDNRSVQWPWPLTGREQIDLQVLAVLIDGSADIPDFDVQAERSDQLADPLLAAIARAGALEGFRWTAWVCTCLRCAG